MLYLLYTLEGLFFVGLAGCVLVVLISWVSIATSSFSRDSNSDK